MTEHRIRLHEPELDGHDVIFRWDVTPQTELYRRTFFRLSFPPHVDLNAVPRALWWRLMVVCLHGHWALLRPCRVELPVRFGASEREFWQRVVDHVTAQLETYGSPTRPGRAAHLVDSGPPLEPVRLASAPERAVVAFSGGKDSLVLAALAAELTERPLLVTVTSPVPWARDHVGAARARSLTEVSRRLPIDLIEVESDFRSCWELGFSGRDGCSLGVHEVSDLPLFQATVAAVAAATGTGRCLMASESDIQYNAVRNCKPAPNGKLLLHREFPSCAATQGALDALLRRFGLRLGSLTYPLHMAQVQGLLLRRYRQLADLQFSCWQAPPSEQACSACPKCFQIALVTLGEGASPRAVGIDPVHVLRAFRDWSVDAPHHHQGPRLHERRRSRHHVVRALRRRSTEEVASILANEPGGEREEAIAVYARLRAEALTQTLPPEPGYVTAFLDLVHSDLRAPLQTILAQHFEPTDEPEFWAMAQRAQELTSWIAAPLKRRRWVGRR